MTVHITDHARVRYLERVMGIDMSLIDAAISSPAIEVADAFGAPFVIMSTGHRAVVRDGCVQTILSKKMRRVR